MNRQNKFNKRKDFKYKSCLAFLLIEEKEELTETEKFCKEAFKLRIGNLSEFQEESNVEVADNPEEYLLPKFEASKVIAGVEEKVGYKLSTTEEFNIPGA